MALPIKPMEEIFSSRRTLLKWGLVSLGAMAATTIPQALNAQPSNSVKTLNFNADDFGILNFALMLEELETTFYAAAVNSGKLRDRNEVDYMKSLVSNESAHAAFLRQVLGRNVIYQRGDLSFNQAGLAAILTDRSRILNTVVALEDAGIHAYNGAGTKLTNPTFLLAAGSIVSVEARHVAGIRSLLQRPTTELDSERAVSDTELVPEINPLKGRAYDELYTTGQMLEIVRSLNLLNNPITGSLFA